MMIRSFRKERRATSRRLAQRYWSRLQLESLEDRVVPSAPPDGTLLVANFGSFGNNFAGILGFNPNSGAQVYQLSGPFTNPSYMTEGPDGTLYVTDNIPSGGFVWAVNPSNNSVSALPITGLNGPAMVAYVSASNSLIIVNIGDGTIAGNPHTIIQFNLTTNARTMYSDNLLVPAGIAAVPGQNAVYICDENGNYNTDQTVFGYGAIYKFTFNSNPPSVTTIAQGTPSNPGLFDHSVDLALDASGNILVANTGNPRNGVTGSLFKISPFGQQTWIVQGPPQAGPDPGPGGGGFGAGFGSGSGTDSVEVGSNGLPFIGEIQGGTNDPARILEVFGENQGANYGTLVTGASANNPSAPPLSVVEGMRTYHAVASTPPTVFGPGNQTSTEGALASFSLGSFSDSSNGPWTVTVAWGDGTANTVFTTTTTGTLGSRSHNYSEEGPYNATVSVQNNSTGQSGSAGFQVTVSDPAVLGNPVAVNATAGAAFSGAVATFTDPGGAEANDGTHYAATINWGDQTATIGTISFSNGTFTVSGGHTYTSSGFFTINVSINHEGILTPVTTSASVGTPAAPVVSGPGNQTSSEGATASFNLGSFSDSSNGPWTVTVAWGDGTANTIFTTTATGTLGSRSHNYAEEGPYNATVSVQNNSTGQAGSAGFQVTVSDPAVVGSPVAVNATAGAAFSGAVATFTDPGGAEANDGTHYTATINWGDQTAATTGTISFSNGTFTVSGSHTYASSGSFTITTTINHEGVMTPVRSSASVGTPAAPVVTAPSNQTSSEGTSASFNLGSFTDSGGSGPWAVTVAWGDGSNNTTFNRSQTGTLGSQSHTYTEEGPYTVTVTVQDTADGLSNSAGFQVTVSDPAVVGSPVAVSATAGAAFSGAVATFTDPGGAEANDGTHYAASIDWGDQSGTTSGTITLSGSTFTVSGGHTYASSGSFTITTTINHENVLTTVKSTATVGTAAAPVVTAPSNQTSSEGASASFNLGSFTDSGGSGPWAVTVSWGDSSNNTTFNRSQTGSLGSQSHTYTEEGPYTVTVSVKDNSTGQSGSTTFQVTVSDPAVVGSPVAVSATAGAAFSGAVATFTDPGGAEANDGTHYTASIDWGDQSGTTSGTITLSGSTFTVSGSHTYASSGSFTITTTINHENVLTTVKSTATVGTAPAPVVSAPSNQTSSEGSSASFNLGSFTDSGGNGPWAITVAWGDGSNNTTFNRSQTGSLGSQSHTYAEEGPYTVTVTVQDTADGLSNSASFQVTVSDPAVVGSPAAVSATAGAAFSGAVATFTDPGGAEANDGTHYTASIDWGDQTAATTGTITLSGSTFTVSGGHTYASSGSFTITTTINHEGVNTTVRSSASVGTAPAPVVTAPGNQTSSEGTSASFNLGSFTDSGGNGPWAVTVAWGDGSNNTTFNRSQTGTLGSQSHTYAEEGPYTVTVTVQDTGDGLSNSASFQVTVSDPAVVGSPVAVNATAGAAFSGAVAIFTDPGGAEANDGTHYTATIDWGDQTAATTGTISVSGSTFTVSGSHTYASSGSFTVTTSINHEGVSTTVKSSASVSPATATATTTTINSSSPTSVFGQSVTFTANVSGSGGTPTGTVSFLDGSATIGSGTLSGGVATFTTSTLSVGRHTITASYGGDNNFQGSTSSKAVAQSVQTAQTTTVLTATPNPSQAGGHVTFTATITVNPPGSTAAANPTGTVTFFDGTTQIGQAAVSTDSNGTTTATFLFAGLSAGTHTVTASYSGDGNFQSSPSGPLTQTVNGTALAGTTTTVTSSINPSASGQSVTFTATVTSSTSGKPTGTVTFFDNFRGQMTQIDQETLKNNSNGVATFQTSTLAAGIHSITASYGGDSTFAASTSSPLMQAVNAAIPTLTDGTILATSSPSSSHSSAPTGIVGIDPGTGAQFLVSSSGMFSQPMRIAEDNSGHVLYVSDLTASKTGAIIAVDPTSGGQNLVAKGQNINAPGAIVFFSGHLYVADQGNGSGVAPNVIDITPSNGKQKLLTSGGSLQMPVGLAQASNGNLFVLDETAFGTGAIFQLDVQKGTLTVFSKGNGLFDHPVDLTLDQNGNLIVINQTVHSSNPGTIVEVDHQTGAATLVSPHGIGPGLTSGAVNLNHGIIYVGAMTVGNSPGQIFFFDPATGNHGSLSQDNDLDLVEGVFVYTAHGGGDAAGPNGSSPASLVVGLVGPTNPSLVAATPALSSSASASLTQPLPVQTVSQSSSLPTAGTADNGTTRAALSPTAVDSVFADSGNVSSLRTLWGGAAF
jgi:hypothetical protein